MLNKEEITLKFISEPPSVVFVTINGPTSPNKPNWEEHPEIY
jgi:hypothetical protein